MYVWLTGAVRFDRTPPSQTTFQILIVEIIWKKEMKVIIYLGGFINRGPLGFNK
jgi:hypothetical protein